MLALAERVRQLRSYGEDERYRSVGYGRNSRIDALQAAVLRVKLGRLEGWNERRRELASCYGRALADTGLIAARRAAGDASRLAPLRVRTQNRDALRDALAARGVETLVHYPRALHQHPAYARARSARARTERAARGRGAEPAALPAARGRRARAGVRGPHRRARVNDFLWKLKWTVKAITPPIFVLAAKHVLIALGLRKPDAPPEPEPVTGARAGAGVGVRPGGMGAHRDGSERQGLGRRGRRRAYREKWPPFLRGDRGRPAARRLPRGGRGRGDHGRGRGRPQPRADIRVRRGSRSLAARSGSRSSTGAAGLGHYGEIARAVLPVEVDYHCREVPATVAVARELGIDGRFVSDDAWADRSYDLVMASGSLQYAEDWCAQLGDARSGNERLSLRHPAALRTLERVVPHPPARVSLRLRDRVRRLGRQPRRAAGLCRRPRAHAGAGVRDRRLALGSGRAGGSDRAPRLPLQRRRRPRGSRSLIRPSKSAGSSSLGRVGGQALVLARLQPGQEGREEQRLCERGVAAAARRPRSQRPLGALDRAADRHEALCVRVENPPRPVRRRRSARNEVGDRDGILLDDGLLLRGERRRRLLAQTRPGRRRRGAARRCSGRTSTSSSSGVTPTSDHQKRNSSRKSNASR